MTVILWSMIATGALLGGWRGFVQWGRGSALAGVPEPGVFERCVGAIVVGVPFGACLGLFAAWAIAVIIGP